MNTLVFYNIDRNSAKRKEETTVKNEFSQLQDI